MTFLLLFLLARRRHRDNLDEPERPLEGQVRLEGRKLQVHQRRDPAGEVAELVAVETQQQEGELDLDRRGRLDTGFLVTVKYSQGQVDRGEPVDDNNIEVNEPVAAGE